MYREIRDLSGRLKDIQSMAKMLKQGATLTELSCPVCTSPLFGLKNKQLWCVKCEKRVVLMKAGGQSRQNSNPMLLSNLESTLLKKIEEINMKMSEASDPDQLHKLGVTLSGLLENLEKTRAQRKMGNMGS